MQWLFGDDALTSSMVSCNARLKTSTLFEDKVSALNELESLSRSHPLEVGIKSLSSVCDLLICSSGNGDDEGHVQLMCSCIDILLLLLLPPEQPFDASSLPFHPETKRVYYECNLDLLFTPHSASGDRIDVFIKLLNSDFSFCISMQYNVMQILTVILLYKNTRHKLRSELMNIYGAMNTLSELLNTEHELIRNSCIILLSHLSANDASIQKLIAFDGAFERILSITCAEDGVEGGMVVMDCCTLLHNLLINNESNQKYFVEIGCCAQLLPLLRITSKSNECKQEIEICSCVVNILMQIIAHCGSLTNTQNAMRVIMDALMSIIDKNHNYTLLKQKCLILLRSILYLNGENINTFVTRLTHKNALLFMTRLSLNYDLQLSVLSSSVLMSIFASNRALQQLLIKSLIEYNEYHEFGHLLSSIICANHINDIDDAPRYWMTTKILTLLFNDNKSMKIYVLSHKVRTKNEYLMDIVMRALMQTSDGKTRIDQRIQCGILLLLIALCFECRESLFKLCATQHYMKCFVQLAINDMDNANDYNRGLSTYLIALCLQFARDLTPHASTNISKNNEAYSPYLFGIIHDEISIQRFKSNLDKLRNTKEYQRMIVVIEKCRESSNASNNANEMQKQKRLMIDEIFINEFHLFNDEYLLLKDSRIKVHLFDSTFVRQFESIYCVIDKRIIQLISHFNINTKKQVKPLSNDENHSNALEQFKIENQQLSKQNEQLRKQIQKQNEIMNNNDPQIMNKYNDLRKTYDSLNRDHEDLLVFVGHLHDKYEEIQTELNKLKSDTHN